MLRILFSLLHPGYLRHYREPIRILAERGHEIHVALGKPEKDPGDARLIEELAAEFPSVTYSVAPARALRDGWRRIAWLVRALMDVSRYAHPRYADSPALRGRMAEKLHWRLDYSRLPGPLKPPFHRMVERLCSGADPSLAEKMRVRLARLEEAIPTNRRITRFVAARRPDVVAASPVIEFASTQIEYLKSARRLRIPTCICVASWDNLTGKGLLRFVPDRVLVWNAIQRQELEQLHGIPDERIVLTGAQRFDEWFDRRPSSSSEEFARKVGLDPSLPYILYLCSSAFIAPDEVAFVRRWLAALRGAGAEAVRRAGVLVRPHPQNGRQWEGVDLSDLGNVAIWPKTGSQPDSGERRADYFDSLAHSACVVGINTSGLIEAGITGKSVLTVLADEFAGTQEGTLHFHYLRWENGGLLYVARDLDEHTVQLERALEHGESGAAQMRSFVQSFCRPHGLDRPAAPLVAAAIEEAGLLGPRPRARMRPPALALRVLLYPVAIVLTVASGASGGLRWSTRALGRARTALVLRLRPEAG